MYKVAANNLFTSSSKIKNEIASDFGIDILSRTIRRRLNEKNLCGCLAQCKPLVSNKKYIKTRLAFSIQHVNKLMIF